MKPEEVSVFPVGEKNPFGQYFVGQSYLNMLTTSGVPVGNVTFEPGCRNNWHIHHAKQGGGQILLCTAGRGYYQEWGQPARELHPGDVVVIPPEVKHWHGAAKDSWFAHLAIEVPGEQTANEWCEPVSDESYSQLKQENSRVRQWPCAAVPFRRCVRFLDRVERARAVKALTFAARVWYAKNHRIKATCSKPCPKGADARYETVGRSAPKVSWRGVRCFGQGAAPFLKIHPRDSTPPAAKPGG